MKFKENILTYKENGFCFFSNTNIEKKIATCKKIFEKYYLKNLKYSKIKTKINLIKRFTGDPSIQSIFYDYDLQEFIKKLGIKHPIQTGPVVSHYTSKDKISNSKGLPLHQDFPSVSTSPVGCIDFFNINNFKTQKIHGLEVCPTKEKKILPITLNSKGIAEISEKYLRNKKFIKLYPRNKLLIMSLFLPHRTLINHSASAQLWRLGLSTRFNDITCKIWKKNRYQSAYSNQVDRNLYKKITLKI